MSNQKRLRLVTSDHLGLPRGKYLPMPERPKDGASRFCQGIYALTYAKSLVDAPGGGLAEGLPDIEVRYHASEIRPGWEDDTLVVIGDQYQNNGNPLPTCGRQALKRAVAEWQKLGFFPKFGIELEAYVFERDDEGSLRPFDLPGGFVYSTGPALDPNYFLENLWNAAQNADFKIESFQSEFDAPQFEFSLAYDHAVNAIDEIFRFKIMAREIAHHCDLVLTFMPKPIASLSGSGVHFNLSFADATGKNMLGDASPDDLAGEKLSPLMRGATAGLMTHHRALAGLLAPTVNSYARLQPASLSGYWRNWGYDHRGVTTRLSSQGGAKSRLEHRMADAACNLYTAGAAILQAARLGFIQHYALPQAESSDCITAHDAQDGVAENLAAALSDLAADQALVTAVGAGLVENHIAIKTKEIEEVAALSGDAARDYYLNFV